MNIQCFQIIICKLYLCSYLDLPYTKCTKYDPPQLNIVPVVNEAKTMTFLSILRLLLDNSHLFCVELLSGRRLQMGCVCAEGGWISLVCGHSLKEKSSVVSGASCTVSCFLLQCVQLDITPILGYIIAVLAVCFDLQQFFVTFSHILNT